MKQRCLLCEKKANNDGLCKFHRCRCKENINTISHGFGQSKQFSHGCLIHDKGKK